MAGTAVVLGATGGIGAGLLAALEAEGRWRRVLGLSRRGDPPLDITDEASVAAAAAWLGREAPDLALVILATGFLHDARFQPEKAMRQLDPAHLAHSFAVNAIGPALAMKHLLPRLRRDGPAVFAALSARVGSIGDNRLGGWWSYRASKAALNQLVRTAAVELRRSNPGASIVAVHPGTVDTGLSGPFSKAGLEVQRPPEAARHILEVLAAVGPDRSGAFLDHRGEPVPW
ncbi:SDR family NAD(P)-dependent oxidoreductase [Paracraurococcus ruber]|uniref:C-factor n=2 Tax=Paracraurococcus ruber TaxID=77675 RepID=A0ABS1D085_9PROT|nr:SDR family NAD(P)-dependent oxidoreductase [Paracraurococcus ruber]MBK1659971.1 C-factor [Paracraurococcus ruber]TDG28796.1 SDR family NAD(P)-dependent oxidoreductase [Paracraurococcus ruber]